jgi:hypothetical protein
MRQCSLDQGGGYLCTISSLGASLVGLNYYSLMVPCVLLTAMADVTIDFVTDVTYDTVKRLKMASNYPPYRHTNIQQHSRYFISDFFDTSFDLGRESTTKTFKLPHPVKAPGRKS